MIINRRLNCIDAVSGIVTLNKRPSGAQVARELQFSHLLSVTIPVQPPNDEHIMLETCRGL